MRGFLDYALGLSDWQWYRRWRRGHWEGIWVDHPVGSFMWFQQPHGYSPRGLERGTPTCEDWS